MEYDNIDYLLDKTAYKQLSDLKQLNAITYYLNNLAKKYNKEGISRNKLFLIKKVFELSDCRRELLDKSFEVLDLFKICDIELSAFLSYGANTNTYGDAWVDDILNIINSGIDINHLSLVWDYFYKNYFQSHNKKQKVVAFTDFLDTYNDYPELLNNMYKDNMDFYSYKNIELIDKLFNYTGRNTLKIYQHTAKMNVKTVEDLEKLQNTIDEILFSYYLSLVSVDEKKYLVESMLFEFDNHFFDLLNKYGNVERLKLLQFNNRNNTYMVELIENILVITSFIENILSMKTNEEINNFILKLKDNREYLSIIRKMICKYNSMMTSLYELESNYNLTNIDKVFNEGVVDGEKIGKFLTIGSRNVSVVNLSNCKYSLYAHVVGLRENVTDLITGKDRENQVIISLSPISHRNSVYYRKIENKIILAYDHIPQGNFILSSDHNIGSNGLIKSNTADFKADDDTNISEKGILETSMTREGRINAETIVLREGLKPCGIIIPGNRYPTFEEMLYSSSLNIPLIYVQEKKQGIRNPKDIEYSSTINTSYSINNDKYRELDRINRELFTKPTSNRIGVLTDIHSMYEPTLAILEDMRKKGITEIYSLGDNIGFGPNPHEVLELLRKYNVKSIYGNHEIYSIDGMDALSKHLETLSSTTVSADKKRTEWTRSQLTSEDIEDIMKYDSRIVITRGGKKITLVHSKKSDLYEENGHFIKPQIDDDSIIVEGHVHFESEKENDLKLRAAGMGFSSESDYGMARYLIIEEDGSFNKVSVPYNIRNFKESVNESSMGEVERKTIDGFTRR